MLDGHKELTPVIYGENAIKYLYSDRMGEAGRICFPMHWHERMEILYIEKGCLELHCGGELYRLYPGQIAVINPEQLHGGFSGNEGVSYHTIMFDVSRFCNSTIASDKYLLPVCQKKVIFQNKIEDEQLKKLADRIVSMQNGQTQENPLCAIGTVYDMLGILYKYRKKESPVQHSQDAQYSEILEYINGHFTDPICARTISARFGYNESYFCRRFKKITGITFSRYIQALRMEQAQKLLEEKNFSVGTVAFQCGFTDVSYFTKCFKNLFGFTPTQYQKMKS